MIRKLLLLRENDPIDLVVMASLLANFAPDRDVPIWLVIVGSPASGKTDLISLVQDWRHVWTLPDVLSEAYFFSATTGEQSALARIQRQGHRILYTADMGAMMELNRVYSGSLYQQLRGIHDGYLKKETGYNSKPQVYGIVQETREGDFEQRVLPFPPDRRLGWIGAATQEFYPWQARHNMLGSRFTCWYFEPFESWTDYHSLTRIEDARAERSHWRCRATETVVAYLDAVLVELQQHPEAYMALRLPDHHSNRLAAAVKLVQRITGTRNVTDTGARLHPRIASMCRMIAFMSGKEDVGEEELQIGLRLAFSQLPADEHKIIRFALAHEAVEWTYKDMSSATGITRRHMQPKLEAMADVNILEALGKNGFQAGCKFALSAKTKRLAQIISPGPRPASKVAVGDGAA